MTDGMAQKFDHLGNAFGGAVVAASGFDAALREALLEEARHSDAVAALGYHE